MTLSLTLKLLHVLTAFWYVAGVIGRDVTFWRAARESHVRAVHTLLQVSDIFERFAVIPGSILVLVAGLLTAWSQGWFVLGFSQGARSGWLLVSLILFLGIAIAIGPLRLVPRRRQREQAAEKALAEGEITPDLNAALNDKVVSRFRVIELVILVVITILMVTKPF